MTAPQPTAFDLRAAYGEAYALFRADYRDLFDGADVAVTVAPGARGFAQVWTTSSPRSWTSRTAIPSRVPRSGA